MKVLKFGGTSLANVERIKNVVQIISRDSEEKIIVLSAMSGTTNTLIEIADLALQKKSDESKQLLTQLFDKKTKVIKELFTNKTYETKALKWLEDLFKQIANKIDLDFGSVEERFLVAQGEFISTYIFSLYLEELGESVSLLSALDFMRINEDNSPDETFLKTELQKLIKSDSNVQYYVTQGFVCKNHLGEVDNLKRGGSDYTASLVGSALQVSEIQIWTDIDGMHNNDPRIVTETKPIKELTFDEAAELAYFGAKILHPSCILPAQKANVNVHLLSTLNPDAKGTLIRQEIENKESQHIVKAVAAKEDITAIRIHSTRMLLAYGFLRSVFEVFERYKTPIDMITTSEVAVSLTIDDVSNLDKIIQELQEFGSVELTQEQTIICIVGDHIVENKEVLSNVFNALKDFSIRMISYGGSENNISFLSHQENKKPILKLLNEQLFNLKA